MRPCAARRPRQICLMVAALSLPLCLRAQEKKEELPHPKTLEELQQAMKGVLEKNHVPGAGVALVSNGTLLWCGGFGKADLAANREVTCDTEFRVGSISKTFVVLALLKLQDDGKINLYARVRDLAPEIPMTNPWDATNPVRVVNLLEHTAGFDDMSFSEVYNRKDAWNYPLLRVFQDHPGPQNVRWPPGTRFSYSNPGYGVAGYLIEKASRQPFDQYIQENVLAPLGIARGDFRMTEANRPFLAQGYEDNPSRVVPYKNIYLRPAGDMKASPGELAKLVQFFLQRGRVADVTLFKPEAIARMEYPETPASAKHSLRLGYGLANYTELDGGVVTHGHDGGIDGFISTYRYMPEQNWGYVVLLNSTVSFKALQNMNRLAIDFLSKDFPKPQQPVINLSARDLDKFTGYYAPRAPRDQLFAFMEELSGGTRVRVQNGQLVVSGLFDKPEPLLPVGKGLFRGQKEPEASTIFFTDDTGRMCLTGAGMDGISYGERVFPVWPYLRLALLALCFALMITSILFAVVWGLRKLFGGMKDVKHLSVRVAPFVAVLCLAAAIFGFTKAVGNPGVVNGWSVLVWLGTSFFAVLSAVGLALALFVPREEIHRGVRMHSLLVSLSCCIVTLFMASWHLLGLRLWAP